MDSAGIFRNELPMDGNFTTVDNGWIRSSGLTPQANFLWIYLLSHKIGYELRDGQILRETGFGRKGLRAARTELVEKGWLILERMKNADGSLGTYAYHLQEPRDPRGTVAGGTVEAGTVAEGSDLRRLKSKDKTKLENTNLVVNAFNQFWDVYPRKKDKGHALRAMEKALEKATIEQIVAGAVAYRDDPSRDDEFTAYPATWLNGERWEDEYQQARVVSKSPHVGGPRDWVREMHDMGEHFECREGEFGCK
jgi:hypothetical protein